MATNTILAGASAVNKLIRHTAALLLGTAISAVAQTPVVTIEPGMEQAVKWRWSPEASDPAKWGLSLEAPPSPINPVTGKAATPTHPQGPPETTLDYLVQKGDSLYVIARRHGVTVDQLKLFNQIKRDVIVVGQTLRIPSLADIKIMAPPSPPPAPKAKAKSNEPPKAVPVEEDNKLATKRPLPSAASTTARIVLMQAYLDRKGFSAGPIDGTDGPLYDSAVRSYENEHPGELTYEMGQVPAVLRDMGGAYTDFQLRREDLRWIAPEKPVQRNKKSRNAPPEPGITLEELTSAEFLPYRNVWEFIAERYHCSESFLRRINPAVKSPVTIGTLFFVPNVIPFEIENAFTDPLQPPADPSNPVTASVISNTRMEIRRSGKLIANLPISVARPGLRGRGTWKILEAIPRPKMTTQGAPEAPTPMTLPPGPNNPVGLVWINLAKSKEPTILPYGLHGTSIPGHMRKQESIGGFRMTNWNIVYAMKLLPVGTSLTWQN